MNCNSPTATELRFLSSGIKIAPFEATYKSSNREYDYVRVKTSIGAARLIDNKANIPEPVDVYTDEEKLTSVYIPEDGIRIGKNEADIELYDPQKFLDRGTIDKYFDKISLDNLVNWFEEQVDQNDPNNVINDVQIIQGGNADPDEIENKYSEIENAEEAVNSLGESDNLFEVGQKGITAAQGAASMITKWGSQYVKELDEDGGFDFNQITLAECLNQIEEKFQISSYIDENRNLRIGVTGLDSKFHAGGKGPNIWNISDYNITIDPSKVSQVYVKGGYITTTDTPQKDSSGVGIPAEMQEPSRQKLQVWGYATTSNDALSDQKDIPGEAISMNVGVTSGQQLENIAIRRLQNEIGHQISGNVTVNCISSPNDISNPVNIKPQDTFGIIPPTSDKCGVEIPETAFVVESVRHEIRGSSWNLQLELTQVPEEDVYSASFKSQPTSAQFMSSEQFYMDTASYTGGLNLEELNQQTNEDN